MAQLIAITLIPVLCIGFMIFSTITWYCLERKMDIMRKERSYIRSEMDSLRQRLQKIENKETNN